MLIYLDVCAIQRPLDDLTQVRVRLEAAAVLALLDNCRAGGASLVSSDSLVYEAGRNPHPDRRAYAEDVLAAAVVRQSLTDDIEARAAALVAAGLLPLDALHLASAEAAGVHYFCTCDDRLLKRGRASAAPPVRVVSPVELTSELDL